jgi:bacterioferritin-associated ferredoxin
MIICSCNVLSDHEVRESLQAGQNRASVGAIFRHLGREPQCGRCAQNINAIVQRHSAPPMDKCQENGDCESCQEGELAA